MKILVVAGSNPIYKFGNPIFLDLAIQIKKLLLEEHTTSIAVDIWDEKVRHFTNKRKKNRNFLTFLSQYLIKLYEIAFLQQKYIRRSKKRHENFNQNVDIYSGINSLTFKEILLQEKFDVIICLGTSIVKKDILEASDFKFLNLHPGVLPQYRGIGNFWAVLNNDFENIGISLHWMNEKIDDGKIISIVKIPKKFKSLWDMNIMAFEAGVVEIANLINKYQLFNSNIRPHLPSKYYGWYGLKEYLYFKKILKKNYEI